MEIAVVNKSNKEKYSMTTVIIDGKEFALTEKELSKLVEKLYDMRQDVFENLDIGKVDFFNIEGE